jgi:hypothetical protein
MWDNDVACCQTFEVPASFELYLDTILTNIVDILLWRGGAIFSVQKISRGVCRASCNASVPTYVM